MTKAIGLISGGLDSILAARIILEQAIEVIGVAFTTPFFGSQGAEQAAQAAAIPLRIVDITELHLAMVQSPKHGYGSNMNPCIDCHALMLGEAGRLMEREGSDFLFTGEVLGQRPMSQNKAALRIVERESGYEGKVLRPLSAKLLPETLPEQVGLIDRERLLAISGRSRKQQLGLAKRYHITHYLTPAGGCLLTDPIFSRRLRDLFDHQEQVQVRDIELLKIGRHLRFSPRMKMIVGRNAQDNERISQLLVPGDALLKVEKYPGPLCLIPYGGSPDDVTRAAAICIRYSDAPKDEEIEVLWSRAGEERRVNMQSCPPSLPAELMI
jgi:tRNA U34 2-thiouridine synthase MnmA/TrmU